MTLLAHADSAQIDARDTRGTPHAGARHDETLSELMSQGTVATSFGVFKPVGCVMVGLPGAAQADDAVRAFHHAGWPSASLQRFAPHESINQLEAMVDSAGGMAGFGYEITLLRQYLALSRQGVRWLLVKVDGVEHAATAAEVARRCGAILAVHYRLLTIDELI
jgi:hypothetical protein